MAELCFRAGWKAELISDDLGSLTEGISQQSVKGAAWLLTGKR